LFERLGVAEQIKGKLILVKAAGQAVADGEAEMGFTQVSEILAYAGAEVGSMLPPDIQSFTSFSIGARSKDSKPAEALVKFLTTPEAAAVIRSRGLSRSDRFRTGKRCSICAGFGSERWHCEHFISAMSAIRKVPEADIALVRHERGHQLRRPRRSEISRA
jgi:hypothetical protein